MTPLCQCHSIYATVYEIAVDLTLLPIKQSYVYHGCNSSQWKLAELFNENIVEKCVFGNKCKTSTFCHISCGGLHTKQHFSL